MTKAVLDACVLYPAPLRDILLSVASIGCFSPFWSDLINDEWTRSVLRDRADLNAGQLLRTVQTMNTNFSGACITGHQGLIPTLTLPDVDDRHVLAVAIHSQAQYIVTNDLGHFPQATLSTHNITVISPDDFIEHLYIAKDMGELIVEALAQQRNRLRNPEVSVEEFIATIQQQGLNQLGQKLEAVKNNL